MRHDGNRVKHIASLVRDNLNSDSWRKEFAVEVGLETYADPLIERTSELESFVSNLKHTYCECGDEYTNVSESHYMIIEDGNCVNCRCGKGKPLEIKDKFLRCLYEDRKLAPNTQ